MLFASRCLPLWLCLLWLAPQTGLALPHRLSFLEAPTARAEDTLASHGGLFQGTPAPRSLRRAGGRITPGRRIALEVVLGLLGGTVGGVAGYFGVSAARPCADGTRFCDELVMSTNGLAGLGIALGVFAGGELNAGEADFVFGPFIGAAVGFALGYALSAPFIKGVGLITSPPLMLLGAMVGYELSVKGPSAFRHVQPLVGLVPQGAQVGVMGRF